MLKLYRFSPLKIVQHRRPHARVQRLCERPMPISDIGLKASAVLEFDPHGLVQCIAVQHPALRVIRSLDRCQMRVTQLAFQDESMRFQRFEMCATGNLRKPVVLPEAVDHQNSRPERQLRISQISQIEYPVTRKAQSTD
jgi:hypothetical protein